MIHHFTPPPHLRNQMFMAISYQPTSTPLFRPLSAYLQPSAHPSSQHAETHSDGSSAYVSSAHPLRTLTSPPAHNHRGPLLCISLPPQSQRPPPAHVSAHKISAYLLPPLCTPLRTQTFMMIYYCHTFTPSAHNHICTPSAQADVYGDIS